MSLTSLGVTEYTVLRLLLVIIFTSVWLVCCILAHVVTRKTAIVISNIYCFSSPAMMQWILYIYGFLYCLIAWVLDIISSSSYHFILIMKYTMYNKICHHIAIALQTLVFIDYTIYSLHISRNIFLVSWN